MMDAINLRVLLGLAAIFLAATLWTQWQEDHSSQQPQPVVQSEVPSVDNSFDGSGLSTSQDSVPDTQVPMPSTPVQEAPSYDPSRLIEVSTDVFDIKIDKLGGDIVYASLKDYPAKKDTPEIGFTLLDRGQERYYVAQTGLIHADGPDYQKVRATYASTQSKYELNGDTLQVELFWQSDKGVEFTKVFTFKKGEYLVDVSYIINNNTSQEWAGKMYGRLQREPKKANGKGLAGMQTYQGGAFFTPDKKFKKVSFGDMEDKAFSQTIKGGWAAMVEHYFVSAWIPDAEVQNDYFTSVSGKDRYNVGALTTVRVPANTTQSVKGQLYMGPEIQEVLENISPGLELTVDYGVLWPISSLIFWVMKHIYDFIGNWGWSIILVTVLIKALFFKLSAASYRSMGHLRRVQPKIQALKERFGDDKQKFSQAMMELYKKEKINPLGGCLPILIQIPVFIALYYVLLESVELRQAPFMLWLQDLSSKDPYYILPLLMGASMLVQQKLSPAPPDPIQAKMMMLMPVIFTVLFLTFPSGLVLYWVVNNLLSIAQQWVIMRGLEKEGLGHRKKA